MALQFSVYKSLSQAKNLFLAITLTTIFIACKTLTSKSIAVDLPCHECQTAMKDSLLATEGIYYTSYNSETGELTYKYDSSTVTDEQIHFLLYQWSTSQKDSLGSNNCCSNDY